MRSLRLIAATAALSMIFSVGCSTQRASNPSVKDGVENSLKTAGFKDINVDEDRNKGVITLKGNVATQADKEKAEAAAKSAAGNDIIANELLVTGSDKDKADDVADATDDSIESSFKAMVAKNNWKDQHIRADAEKGVLTLTGDVDTADQRASVESASAKLPGVKQVGNKLVVKGDKKHNTRR